MAAATQGWRFYLLYDKIYRGDILRHPYALARANAGAGGDGKTSAAIEASGLKEWLAGLREELVSKGYRPDPVRRVTIPKPGGGERPLGIPTIRDRVVQTAAKLVLEPIFEADFEDRKQHPPPLPERRQFDPSGSSKWFCRRLLWRERRWGRRRAFAHVSWQNALAKEAKKNGKIW